VSFLCDTLADRFFPFPFFPPTMNDEIGTQPQQKVTPQGCRGVTLNGHLSMECQRQESQEHAGSPFEAMEDAELQWIMQYALQILQ
jgi:hypothetical protein